MAVQAPAVRGPNLAAMTVRERAEHAWEQKKIKDRCAAEVNAKVLAGRIFGNVPMELGNAYADDYAERHSFWPSHNVCIHIEGMVFRYQSSTKRFSESLVLLRPCSHCNCELASVAAINDLWEVGWAYENASDAKCLDCRKAEEG